MAIRGNGCVGCAGRGVVKSFVQKFLQISLFFVGIAFAGATFASLDSGATARVSSMQQIRLGGVEQAILVRGENSANPVLLYLHGGPGVAEMPFSYKNAELERDFVVVHWDQRGAGKSFRPGTPGMNIRQFVDDTIELSRALRAEFGGRKIVLVGHSWGSLVGALAVAREPQLYRAYVGIGQLVNIARSEREMDLRARIVARERGDEYALRKLQAIGPYPYADHTQERKVNAIQKRLMGTVPHDMTPIHFAGLALVSPYYTPADYARLLRGIVFSGKSLEREIYAADLFSAVPEIDVPVYLLEGRHDTVLSPIVAADYFEKLRAPRGKHLVWFEQSNHWPQLEEREKYRATLRSILAETAK